MKDYWKTWTERTSHLIAAAFIVMLLSIFVISKAAADPANHTQTLEALDEKKNRTC